MWVQKNYGRQREIIAVRTSFLAKLSLIREASASSISKTKKRNSNVFLERASQTKFVTCDSDQTTINQSGIKCQKQRKETFGSNVFLEWASHWEIPRHIKTFCTKLGTSLPKELSFKFVTCHYDTMIVGLNWFETS